VKDSYRIGNILKRLTGIKFLKSRQTATLSKNGKEKAKTYLSSHSRANPLRRRLPHAADPAPEKKEAYIRYQQEIEAAKLLNPEKKPQPPGRILKLPTGRKELMSKSEE
jgi:hypothetical protein